MRRGGSSSIDEAMPPDADSPPSSNGVRWILGGALIGFWLALGWKRVVGFEAWPEEAMVGMFAAGVTWWLMWPWIIRGTLPPRLCGVGVLVLLVALLAVGGITFGGVNETLWLLLAIGLNATEFRSPASRKTPSSRNRAAPCHCRGSSKCSCWRSSCSCCSSNIRPATNRCSAVSRPWTKLGIMARRSDQASLQHELDQLTIAAEADPYAVEPRRLLAGFWLGQWIRGDEKGGHSAEFTGKLLGEFENWMNQALKIDPQSGPLQLEAATAWRLVFTITLLPADGRKAVEFCRQAVELYPTGVVEQYELARTLSMTGDLAAAKEPAREALRLDDLRPADERALSAEQRKLAERIILGDNKAAPPPTAPAHRTAAAVKKRCQEPISPFRFCFRFIVSGNRFLTPFLLPASCESGLSSPSRC